MNNATKTPDRPLMAARLDNKPVLVWTLGLQGSGKSTWAKELVASDPTSWVRVNKDDLRAMMHGSHGSKGNEAQVLRIRDAIISDSLAVGKSVIVDDTNLHAKHPARFSELASSAGVELICADFTDVPLDVCIKRDRNRASSIGEKAIRATYNQFMRDRVS